MSLTSSRTVALNSARSFVLPLPIGLAVAVFDKDLLGLLMGSGSAPSSWALLGYALCFGRLEGGEGEGAKGRLSEDMG